MALYHHRVSNYHKSKRARKIRKLGVLVLILVIIGVGAISMDWVLNRIREDGQDSIGSRVAVQSSTINIFRTPYFQFQADKTWREVDPGNQEVGRYVYRSYNDILVQHELIVEVDKTVATVLDSEQTSRVLPVSVRGNYLLSDGAISPHCKELISDVNNREQQFIEYKQVTFPCDPNGGQFVVLVGQIGGKHYIEKETETGMRTYKIIYRDSTFSPSGKPLGNIINSFQLL